MAHSLTSRPALRTINDDQDSIKAQKSIEARKPGTEAPRERLFDKSSVQLQIGGTRNELQIHTDSKPGHKTKSKDRVIVKEPEPLPDRELLKVFNPAEDLKPKTDRALFGVVERIRKWRPPCMFAMGGPDSDTEDSDEQVDYKLDQSDKSEDLLPLPDDTFFGEELANLSDLHIPTVDIEDLPLPYLDDSIDIEPNMGTLEIWNSPGPTFGEEA